MFFQFRLYSALLDIPKYIPPLGLYLGKQLTLYNFSFWYQTSSSSSACAGPSRLRSSLERERIFRRDTISPLLLGPQLQKRIWNILKIYFAKLSYCDEVYKKIMKINFYLFGIAHQLGVSPTNCMQCAFIAISCIKMQVPAAHAHFTRRPVKIIKKRNISLHLFTYLPCFVRRYQLNILFIYHHFLKW